MCGLAASVGLFLWNPTGNTSHQQVVDQPEIQAESTATLFVVSNDEPAVPPTPVAQTQSNCAPVLEPVQPAWQVSDMFVVDRLVQNNASPLSLAAQRSWSLQMRAAESNNRLGATNAVQFDTERDVLRAGPINEDVFKQLLL